MPRRPRQLTDLQMRRLRRAQPVSVVTGLSRLIVTSAPPATLRSGIATSGASVRLQSPLGTPIFLADVPVSIVVSGAAGAILVATPTPALTNSSGIASFTALTLSGLAGPYSFTFSAPGYLPAVSSGHVLGAGFASAAQSRATVPDGTINQQTTITIQLKDAQGNQLTQGGTSTVTVQITGANPRSEAFVPIVANGYTYTYTPTSAGTDSAVIRYGGTAIGGSPYPSTVSSATGGFKATSLRVGLNNNIKPSLLGTGASGTAGVWTTTEPIFRAALGYLDPDELEDAIPIANAKNITLFVTFPGNRDAWTDLVGGCKRYNDTKFKNGVDSYLGRPAIVAALASRRVILYMFDEPWIADFCNTCPPTVVRDGFRYVKSKFPDSLCVGRIEPHHCDESWGPTPSSGSTLPPNYFDKMDYGWGLYRGKSRAPSKNMTPRQYYQFAKTKMTGLGYGVIYAHNWANLGDIDCWDAFNTGDSNAHIHGDSSKTGQSCVIENCGGTETDTLWVESPARIVECAVAAAEDPDCPAMMCYIHPAGTGLLHPNFIPLMQRNDYRAGWNAAIQAGENRTTPFRWRTPK